MTSTAETFPCPNCGADVRAGAPACRACGSDAETGWSEDTIYDDLDLPDPGYGPDEPAPRAPRAHGGRTGLVVAIVALIALAAWLFLARR